MNECGKPIKIFVTYRGQGTSTANSISRRKERALSNIDELPLYFQKYIERGQALGVSELPGEKEASSPQKGKVYPLIILLESLRVVGLIVVTSSPPPPYSGQLARGRPYLQKMSLSPSDPEGQASKANPAVYCIHLQFRSFPFHRGHLFNPMRLTRFIPFALVRGIGL